jgi:signal transduction histidine kinase/ActR/RegA family two-component response regulator
VRVLVIEDDAPVCGLFKDVLLSLGHQPLIAHTAEDALDLLRTERLDAVLLDIRLPGMSGLDFLRLQANRKPPIPFIVVSGAATESQASECLRLGAFDFMGKPVQIERLREVLACLEPTAAPAPATDAPPGDKRRAPRAAVALPVRVTEYNGVEWEGTSVNLSPWGIKVQSNGPVSPGPAARLSLTMPDGGSRIEVASVLLRADVDGYAFYFINLTAPQLHRLHALVQRFSQAGRGQAESHLEILRTIAEALSQSLDVEEVLHIALDALTRVTGHEISSLHLVSPEGTTLHLHGDRGLRPQLRQVNRVLPVGQGLIGQVAATGRTIHVGDVQGSADLLPAASAVVGHEGIRGFVCVAIQRHGRILGTLSLGRRGREPFTDAEVSLVEASAHQIGLALENARLYAETRRQLDDLKHAEAQRAEGERLSTLGKLAVGLAHEVNNPLTAILGQAELLMTRSEQSPEAQERLQVVIRETSRAARLLQDLLQLSRRQRPERRPANLEAQIRVVLDLKRDQLDLDRIQVVTEFAPVGAVWADEDQLRQVLLNLVQNAHQSMAKHPGPRVLTARISAVEEIARVEILDTGPGIPRDVLPRIFDAFFTTKPRGEGTGLGLWVSYSIIEEHGGRLRADNRPQGGAVFTVELPCSDRVDDKVR